MDQSEWTTDPGLRQRNWSRFPFCSVSLVARQLSPPPIHTTSPGIETQVPTALRNLGSFCRYRKALYFWSLGISLYLELFCFLSFITIVLRNLCSGTHRRNRNLCWRKKINKWINLSNKWISINDHSNNTDMSKGRLLFLSNFPLKTWLWKHCTVYVCSHIQDISIVLKAKQINYQRTKQTGLVCHLGA